MNYDSRNTGGIGVVVEFPESLARESITLPVGSYEKANIERLELEAIIQGMKLLLELFNNEGKALRNIGRIIFITDRYKLCDIERTSALRIRDWRRSGWKTFEDKPIKNADLLHQLDKTRLKLSKVAHRNVEILYARSKYNKKAHRAAAAGKSGGLTKRDIGPKGAKIGRRIFSGSDVDYQQLSSGMSLVVRVYKKEPVGDQWEISAEICDGKFAECKIMILADNQLETRLHRQHTYSARLKAVRSHHVILDEDFEDYLPG